MQERDGRQEKRRKRRASGKETALSEAPRRCSMRLYPTRFQFHSITQIYPPRVKCMFRAWVSTNLYHTPPSNNPISFRRLAAAPSLRIDMSDGPREIQNFGVCSLYEGVPSQAQGILPVVHDPRARPCQLPPIAIPRTLSAASRADLSQYRVPEPSLKQAEKLIGIFDDERGMSFCPLLACR